MLGQWLWAVFEFDGRGGAACTEYSTFDPKAPSLLRTGSERDLPFSPDARVRVSAVPCNAVRRLMRMSIPQMDVLGDGPWSCPDGRQH